MAASNDQLTRDRNTCSKPFPFVPFSLWGGGDGGGGPYMQSIWL
jgi:hypothetical protein